MTGRLPSQLGRLSQLQVLWLERNNFSGTELFSLRRHPRCLGETFEHPPGRTLAPPIRILFFLLLLPCPLLPC